jgi:glycosyltransferase involved in cell wall biosynthesis
MPVFNGATTVGMALESCLGQSVKDIEVIVSDNASTDETREVVLDFERRDPRVRLIARAENIGANGNYSATARLARGRYFKWMSASDWMAPDFLFRSTEVLNNDELTVLVCPSTRLFEADTSSFTDYPDDVEAIQDDPVERMAQAWKMRLNNLMNGVIRRDVLCRTNLIEHYPSADVVLIAHLALLGKIRLLPDRLLYRRMAPGSATSLMDPIGVLRHHYPVATWRSILPNWRYFGGCFRAVVRSGMPASGMLRASALLLRKMRWQREDLLDDIAGAFAFGLARAGIPSSSRQSSGAGR